MYDGGQLLLLCEGSLCSAVSGECIDNAAVKVRGSHFDRVTWQGSRVKSVEPTGMQVIPGTVGHDLMSADAILPGLGERAVGDLKHAECARGGTIDFKRMPGPLPAPIRESDRVAATLNLRQRGEQLRRNNICRMLFEKRPVTFPGRFRIL